MPFDSERTDDFASLRSFVHEHRCALAAAADLLGGTLSVRRFNRLVLALFDAGRPTQRLRRELNWLHGLLTLERVADLDSVEAERFARIDPASPVVADICLLAEGLSEQLQEIQPEAV